MAQSNQALNISLVGASVGEGWDFSALPHRMSRADIGCEFIGRYDFDKSSQISNVLTRSVARPDYLIIKECAAYFPGHSSIYKELIKRWVSQCRNAGVGPVLATVVPVTKSRFFSVRTIKNLVKHYLLGRETISINERNAAIASYNDWLREYASENAVPVLDLEAALRVSETDRTLDVDYDAGDGLHLNRPAYERLDRLMLQFADRSLSTTLRH